MVSVEESEVVDDVFFDSSDVLSNDEEVKEGEVEFQVWSGEPVSVEERRKRFLKKMGLLEERFERVINDYSHEVTTTTSDSSFDEDECCVREQNYGFTSSMSDEELEGENDDLEQNSTKTSLNFSKKRSKKWLFTCFAGEKDKDFETMMSKVKVKTNKKSDAELSGAYMVQKINGHKGRIWSLKFSPDGKFLATGGEDEVVKIWRIVLSDSLLACFMRQQEPISEQEALVLFPQKAFHIEEKPFQELYGHKGDVLDLAWSPDSKVLLSASKDKTVRLWRIGSNSDQCLHVFHHNNYVTCVEFNPVNKNNFISGSIDGKARIWGLSEKRVVAWTDVRDSISAICYQPNGNGFVVGCITGICRFYQTSGNDVVMDEQILIRRRNRITAVEFCPGSSVRLMVSSDDSKLRIFDKSEILHKFKVSYGKQSSASFISSAGKYIISVRRGLGIYLWNNDNLPAKKHVKSSRSFEYFHSPGVSAAAAWSPPGIEVLKVVGDDDSSRRVLSRQVQTSRRSSSRSCRVTATWPEEKLLKSNSIRGFNENTVPVGECYFPGAWRLVIVTASLDGMIRTFHNYGLPRRL